MAKHEINNKSTFNACFLLIRKGIDCLSLQALLWGGSPENSSLIEVIDFMFAFLVAFS